MLYTTKYKKEADNFQSLFDTYSGTVCWESPSNIALIKYWGKRENQLPRNPSLSFTLSDCFTRTKINYTFSKKYDKHKLNFLLDGMNNDRFEVRINNYIESLYQYLPYLQSTDIEINTENSFPHSTGIASSASAFSALALCLLDIGNQLKSIEKYDNDFFKKASYLARLGSGSAARSVYGGVVLWGETNLFKNSSDEVAIPIKVHNNFQDYRDIIIVVDNKEKEISSSIGHELMNDNPFQIEREKQAILNLKQLLEIMHEGDEMSFSELIEYEALSLHAMIMTSAPGNILISPDTLSVIKEIRKLRAESSIPVAFTLDAGANVHVLFPGKYTNEVVKFVKNELLIFCLEGQYLLNTIGSGPRKMI